MAGKIIVIEGACDGIGKSTQYNLLKDYFEKNGMVVTGHHFPSYGTVQGRLVEEYLKGNYGKPSDLDPYEIQKYYAIDRCITWKEELKSHYDNGEIILLDRYTTSSMIYQSSTISDEEEKKKFLSYVYNNEYEVLGVGKPDAVIFLTAPYDLAKKIREARKENDGIKGDIHETDDSYMRNVYESAHFVANYMDFKKVECSEGDAMRSIESIHNEIVSIIESL